jgi:hypothetical protein
MAIAIIMAIVEMAKYVSVGGKTVTGYGEAVGAAGSTEKAVSAYEEKNDLEPAKDA